MDPITAAIVSAAVAGLASGVSKAGTDFIQDTYKLLKKKLQEKFGHNAVLMDAVEQVAKEPDFKPNHEVLAGRVKQVNADKDADLLALANQLLEQLKASDLSPSIQVKGDRNVTTGHVENSFINTGHQTIDTDRDRKS